MDIEHKTAVALKWNAFAKLSAQLISWVVTLVVLRILTPADYGLMAIVMVVISIVSGVAEFGIGASLVQAPTLDRTALARIAGALGLLNLACGAAVAFSAPWLAGWFGDPDLVPLIQVAAVQFLFAAIEVVPQSLLQRELDFTRVARIEIAGALVSSLCTLMLAVAGMEVWALVLGWLIGGAVRAALFAATGRLVVPRLGLRGIAGHIRFGGIITITRVIWQFTMQMDTIIAGRFLGKEALGLYSVAMHFATLPMNKVMGIVNQVALSAVSRMQEERERLRIRLLEALRLLALASIPCLWGMSCVAPELVDAVLGPKWDAAIIALQLVSLVAPLRMLLGILATALAAIGRAELELRNTIVGAVVLTVSFLVGVRWGLEGLAASWLVAVPLVSAICIPPSARALGLTLVDIGTALRTPVLAGCAMYAAVVFTRTLLPGLDSAWLLPILIAVGCATYVSAIAVLDRTIFADLRRVASAVRG
ncbi:MAG: lipopolysaccharide biosynthesis protein [Steroidobacteraceae bacterium]